MKDLQLRIAEFSTFLLLLFFAVPNAGAVKCPVLFENDTDHWDKVYMTYTLYNDNYSDSDWVEHTVEMECLGGEYWFASVEHPTSINQLRFSDGQNRVTQGFNNSSWIYGWPEDICFVASQTSTLRYPTRKIIYFDVVDRHGWFSTGDDKVLADIFFIEDAPLLNAWVDGKFETSPALYALGSGRAVDGFDGPLYSFVYINSTDKTPCIWLRQKDEPSNAIVSEISNGCILEEPATACNRSVYTTIRKGGNPTNMDAFNMDGIAMPFDGREYAMEWTIPSGWIVQIAMTLTPGNDTFTSNAIKPTDLSSAKNIAENNGYSRFTALPNDASCQFAIASGDPTIEYDNSKGYEETVKVHITFDDDSHGTLNFTSRPICPLTANLSQKYTAEQPQFGMTLELRWNPDVCTPLSDGRLPQAALSGIEISSPDEKVISELQRCGLSATRDGNSNNIIITDSELLNSIAEFGYAAISLERVNPLLNYQIQVTPLPASDVDSGEWNALGLGSGETSNQSASALSLKIPVPDIRVKSREFEIVELAEEDAKLMSSSLPKPEGPAESAYSAATRIHSVCALSGLSQAPDGFSAVYRLLGNDNELIAETSDSEILLAGLSEDDPSDLRLLAVYSDGSQEITSEAAWRTIDSTDAWLPTLDVEIGGTHAVTRSDSAGAEDTRIVYNLAYECRHHIDNPEQLPVYLGLTVERDNAEAHREHISSEADLRPILLPEGTMYRNDRGETVEGNTGIGSAPGGDWASRLTHNERTALYLRHIHCEAPTESTKAEETTVRTHFNLYVPVLTPTRPYLVGAPAARSAMEENLDVIIPDTRGTHTAIHTIPLTDLDKIATGLPATTATTPTTNKIYNLLGTELPSEPKSGLYIKNNKVTRK